MNAPKPPSLYARAEVFSRRAILAVGAGVFAWGLGSVVAGGLLARMAPRVEGLPGPLLALVAIVIQELWVLALIPGLAFALARVGFDNVFAFSTTAAISGTAVRLALDLVVSGTEALASEPGAQVARLLCLGAGLVICYRLAKKAALARRETEARAQAAADAERAQLQQALGIVAPPAVAAAAPPEPKPVDPAPPPGDAPGSS